MNLFVPDKMDYVRGMRPDVECILCGVIKKDPKVVSLEVSRFENCCISLNLYPYNPGHIMIFPLRHVEDLRDFTQAEETEINCCMRMMLDILDELYAPGGFNVGYNIRPCSGASIKHIHMHIVPRYKNEIGFMDLLSGKKIIVENPSDTISKLKKEVANRWEKYLG